MAFVSCLAKAFINQPKYARLHTSQTIQKTK